MNGEEVVQQSALRQMGNNPASVKSANTLDLCEGHKLLDNAIWEGRVIDGLSFLEAKRFKCAFKTELVLRVNAGDVKALAYAMKREWQQPLLAVAAE